MVTTVDGPQLNWANDNAWRLLRALGLAAETTGEATMPEARRAVMRARARTDLSGFARAEERTYGQPCEREGVVELRPVRSFGPALGEEDVRARIEQFARFVEAAEAAGATLIRWQ